MKNYIKLSILSLAVASFVTSCDMDSPSISSLDKRSVFSVYGLAELEVMSINVSFAETESYRGRYLTYYGVNSDVETTSGSYPSLSKKNDDKMSLCNFNTLANNTQMNKDANVYAKFYEGIERANLAIEGIRTYGDIEKNPDMAHLLGEALTMRAVIYNDLIKAWGDVPARFSPNNNDSIYLPRTNKDDIYLQLLKDLEVAEKYCYWPNESHITKTSERVNKSFVKGLRARTALYACGYALRGDGYRRSNNPELSQDKMMAIVKKECLDVINSGKNTLGEFEDNFKNLCKDANEGKEGDRSHRSDLESLWEIPFSSGRGRVLYTWGVKHKSKKDQYTHQAQGGINGPMPYLFYDYSKNDKRRDITCVPYEWSETLVKGRASQELRKITQWCFGKLRYEWMDRIVDIDNDDGINWQYMRLADVYLMAAEAINYLEDPAAAWPYMEPVLSRVLPANEVSALKAKYTASKEAFQNGIVDQRGLEFAGEALRRADLVRWGIIDEKMEEAKKKLQDLANRTGAYADYPAKLYIKTYDETTDKELVSDYGMYVGDGESGEAIVIYGLEKGQTDEIGSSLKEDGFTPKNWFINNDANVITSDYWDGIFINKPSLNYLWPIWKTFIDNSNGMLNNDGNYGQL